jgi:hypothetical protein
MGTHSWSEFWTVEGFRAAGDDLAGFIPYLTNGSVRVNFKINWQGKGRGQPGVADMSKSWKDKGIILKRRWDPG